MRVPNRLSAIGAVQHGGRVGDASRKRLRIVVGVRGVFVAETVQPSHDVAAAVLAEGDSLVEEAHRASVSVAL